MLIVSDASGNMGAIYTEVPFPHAVGYNGGTFWACFNEGLYPIDEIGQFYPEWLGNPE